MQPTPPPQILLSGIDSLYVSFFIDGLGIDWEELAYLKETVQHERRAFAEVTLGGLSWALLPKGLYPYPYVLKRNDVTLSLAEHMSPRGRAQFHSEALWTEGPEKLVADLRTWFAEVGTIEVQPERLSRVDWAFDAALPAADFLAEHMLTRAAKDAAWRKNGTLQTLQFGKGDTMLRIYDKVAEIEEASGKAWLFDLWGRKDGVWRVEFQVRRERLRAAGIETLEDLRAFEGDLLDQLSGTYASLRRPTGDSNRSRWPLHPLWHAVRANIAELDRHGLVRAFDPDTPLAYAEDRSFKSVAGMLKNVAAIRTMRLGRKEPVGIPELLDWVRKELARRVPEPLWHDEVRERVEKRGYGL